MNKDESLVVIEGPVDVGLEALERIERLEAILAFQWVSNTSEVATGTLDAHIEELLRELCYEHKKELEKLTKEKRNG